jgi:type III secretion system low calcium response chaperone LcrH/SycD
MVEPTKDRDQIKKQAHEVIEKLKDQFPIPPEAVRFLEEAAVQVALGAEPKEALGVTPKMMEMIYQQAYNYFQAGKYQDALTIFNVLRSIDITDSRYKFDIAACYHYMHDYKSAAANYLIYREMDPLNPQTAFHLYDCFLKANLPTSALFYLKEALVLAGMDAKYAGLKEKIQLEENYLNQILDKYYSEKYGRSAA